jgi:hypothetical protein
MNIEEELQKLRIEWLEAKRKGNPAKMKTIELRAKVLKLSAKPDPFKEIENIFISTN